MAYPLVAFAVGSSGGWRMLSWESKTPRGPDHFSYRLVVALELFKTKVTILDCLNSSYYAGRSFGLHDALNPKCPAHVMGSLACEMGGDVLLLCALPTFRQEKSWRTKLPRAKASNGMVLSGSIITYSGQKQDPKDKVFGQDIPGTPRCWDIPDPSIGMSQTKALCKAPSSVVWDREWPIWGRDLPGFGCTLGAFG